MILGVNTEFIKIVINKASKCPFKHKKGVILKAGIIFVKKGVIRVIELFQVQNHYNKLFDKH